MSNVVWATIATAGPMGQQRYESEIQAAISRSRTMDIPSGA